MLPPKYGGTDRGRDGRGVDGWITVWITTAERRRRCSQTVGPKGSPRDEPSPRALRLPLRRSAGGAEEQHDGDQEAARGEAGGRRRRHGGVYTQLWTLRDGWWLRYL